MSISVVRGPLVRADEVVFAVADPSRRFVEVALAHELQRPRRVPFVRRGRRWTLLFRRPDANRFEYLLELTRAGGERELVPDPENPRRAPSPFGDKSVVEFPGYRAPEWFDDEEAPRGDVRAVRLRAGRTRLEALLWSAAETDPDEPLPLLVVHDGPEYAQYSAILRLLDHLVSFGEVPLLRAALLPPRADRNESYSASTRYARVLSGAFLPQLREYAPTDRTPIGVGASLGALAMLHAHWVAPGQLGGLFLQSGSYFRQRFDRQESGFVRFARISRFVGHVLAGRGTPAHVPVTMTCGTVEENLANNRAVAAALERHGWNVAFVEHRDAHNWTSWRDALHPHLRDLMLRAWT
jgi:enterochelin esterase family protein